MRSTSGYASIWFIFFHQLQPRDSMAPITRGLLNGLDVGTESAESWRGAPRSTFLRRLVGWLYWDLPPLYHLRSHHGSRRRPCVSWLSQTSTNITVLYKATDFFPHMLQQRWDEKIRRKESSSQPGIKLTATRSWVRHAHHWASRAGRISSPEICLFTLQDST